MMTAQSLIAPDLLHGFMINTYGERNRFQTYIDCALFCEKQGESQRYAYLSSRCRPESISSSSIFSTVRAYDFAIIQTNDCCYSLTLGPANVSRNFLSRKPHHYVSPLNRPSLVHCPMAEIEPIAFDDLLSELQGSVNGRDNQLFMRLEWEDGSMKWTLYAPCRYTNFPNPDMDHSLLWVAKPDYSKHNVRYIQPISGPVLYQDGNCYYQAFVSAHLDPQGTRCAEFCLMDAISFFSLRHTGSFIVRFVRKLLATSWIGRYFMVVDYHRILPVQGQATIFRYKQHA
jgi:hypothetical protein